jgi:undecaprenyl-diphosphatase
MAGDYLADDNVTHRRVKAVDIHSNPPMPYSIDGELVVASHLSFAVVPRAIRVYPGLDYRPDPKGQPVGPMSSRQALFQLIASLLRVLTRATRWPEMGLVLALVTLMGFTWLSFGVTAGEYLAWNREISQNLQQWNDHRLVSLSIAVTRLGDPGPATAITFIIALLYASWRQYRKAIGLVGLLLILGLTELFIKPWFAIPRPDWVTPKLMVSGFGYPSGHALRAGGLISFFILLFLSRRVRRPSLGLYSAALCLFAIAIALSRVHLGLHSATDVIAGLLLGTTLGSFAAVLVQPCKGD